MSQRSSISITTAVVATTTAIAATAAILLVNRFGLEGAFWYIWEGDPYPPHIRDQFNSLDDVSDLLHKERRRLNSLETKLERAKLDNIDDVSPIALWTKNVLPESLEQKLASISYNLDGLAAKVDDVMSLGNSDVKLRKKVLSDEIVSVMERADILITLFKNGTQASNVEK